MVARAVRYYDANPGARKLLIDGKVPADIKLADRVHDRVLGALLEATLDQHFELPEFPERQQVCYHVVEIADLMMQLSVIQSHRITPAMVRHAHLACVGYLRAFLPEKLPRRRAARRRPLRQQRCLECNHRWCGRAGRIPAFCAGTFMKPSILCVRVDKTRACCESGSRRFQ